MYCRPTNGRATYATNALYNPWLNVESIQDDAHNQSRNTLNCSL